MTNPTTNNASAKPAGTAGTDTPASDEQLLRIQRIGERLFNVANCVITFADAPLDFHADQHAVAFDFCNSLPIVTSLLVVPDTRAEQWLSGHRMVAGAPHVRFYVAYPIRDAQDAVVGCINLMDYMPRAFSEIDRRALADLAGIVERELYLRSMNELQLDLEKKNMNLRRKSMIDPLIGSWNRGAIMRILAIESVRCDRMGVPLSLIVVDIDFFKRINDTYGHPAGDSVLVKVTSRLRSCIRQQESLGRYGGEEFLVVLPGTAHDIALSIAERMRMAVASHAESIGEDRVELTISAGVSSTDFFPTASTDELISRADEALYLAKNTGRNRVIQAKPD